MSTSRPPDDIITALEAGVVNITRRVEICERDGTTLWNPEPVLDPDFARLVDGTVTVDYSSDERRKLDITLDNFDKKLRPNPETGLWYDKIIKVYRGITYLGRAVAPKTAIIEAPTNTDARNLKTYFESMGFTKTEDRRDITNISELKDYTFVVVFTGEDVSMKSDLLKEAWAAGKQVVTIGTGSSHTEIPVYSASAPVVDVEWGVYPVSTDSPAVGTFTAEAVPTDASGMAPTALIPGGVAISVWPDDVGPATITGAIRPSGAGSYWFDVHLHAYTGAQTKRMIRAVINFMRGYSRTFTWEVQQGEFMIDNINADHFPNQVKITGRDYTKKLMQSKIAASTTFASGTLVRDIVKAVAINAGVDPLKMRVNIEDEVLLSDMSFERGTDRWTIIKQACQSFVYEVFFDPEGYFVVRKFLDPTTSPVAWTFKTGYEQDPSGANLVAYSRAINDSQIYNEILVYSDPANNEERLPYFGSARNVNPDSPTRIERIGQRTMPPIITNWLTSDEQCQELAEARLSIAALESYDVSFSAIYYPWLEVGEIASVLDPDRLSFEPTKFLLSTLSYPLGLGPMSGTAKRITIVGDSGSGS